MTEYATRDAAIEALLEYVDRCDNLVIINRLPGHQGWRTRESITSIGAFALTDNWQEFRFPAPRVIPPDLTTVWVRNDDNNGWNLDHSKGKLDRDGWLWCYASGYRWKYWTTEEPEGWRG